MRLYVKDGTRYREATLGQVLTAALHELQDAGLRDLAFELSAAILDRVGYFPPPEVKDAGPILREVAAEEESSTEVPVTGLATVPARSRSGEV